MTGIEPPHRAHERREPASHTPSERASLKDVRDPLPAEIRDPFFPAAVRGYDRRAVDGYVQRVNGLIAELQMSGSPRAAVRHALDRVGEQTSSLLQHARETAEEITATAREEAEETTARARAEAQDITADARQEAGDALSQAGAEADRLVASARAEAEEILERANDQSDNALARARVEVEARVRQAEEETSSLREAAETRMRSLRADIAAIEDERRTLLQDISRIAAQLEAVVDEASASDHETPATPAAVSTHAMPPAPANGADGEHPRA